MFAPRSLIALLSKGRAVVVLKSLFVCSFVRSVRIDSQPARRTDGRTDGERPLRDWMLEGASKFVVSCRSNEKVVKRARLIINAKTAILRREFDRLSNLTSSFETHCLD